MATGALVLSFDDGPSLAATPLLSPRQRHAALLYTLARHRIQSVLFVTLAFGADRPDGLAMARDWGDAGQLLGNHTVSHLDLHDPAVTVERYTGEIARCDAALNALPGWRRWFRYTYLNEGQTPERRAAVRQFLAAQGYAVAGVDIDSRDWQHAPRLVDRLQSALADSADLKAAFLLDLRQQARRLRERGPHDRPQWLLMHHSLLTALWLDDAIELLKAEGYGFVPPDSGGGQPVK